MIEEQNIIDNYESSGYKYIGKEKINEDDEDYWYPAYDILYKENVLEVVSKSLNGHYLFFWKEDKSNYCLECRSELINDGKVFSCSECETTIRIREYFKQTFKTK